MPSHCASATSWGYQLNGCTDARYLDFGWLRPFENAAAAVRWRRSCPSSNSAISPSNLLRGGQLGTSWSWLLSAYIEVTKFWPLGKNVQAFCRRKHWRGSIYEQLSFTTERVPDSNRRPGLPRPAPSQYKSLPEAHAEKWDRGPKHLPTRHAHDSNGAKPHRIRLYALPK